ncbi:MAG: cupredoxin domain-containing protein [Alphaproteobacteria bacterium]|nr:cupredoxin domain-containing protein [Alphaproteobacteria bacterium]MCB9928951.1 cupredoxin domain-containing protein [Alphaproteobacteria bacterium]
MGKSPIFCAPRILAVAAVASLLSLPALASGSHAGGHGDGHGGGHGGGMAMQGQPGEAANVSRTVNVVMHDNSYEPGSISVKPGETVRFKIRNAGELVHEFNIGTAAMHADHQEEMMMMMQQGVLMPDHIDRMAARHMQKTMGHGMHNDPNSVLLEPGQSGEVIWTFPKQAAAEIEFGCNVPGHYQSGMHGQFRMPGQPHTSGGS